MAKTPATLSEPEAEPTTERAAPVISPKSVQIDTEGQCLRQLLVRLPESFETSDLADPSIWRRVQSDRAVALRKFDKVVMIAHDEGYLWSAWVAQAGPDFAVLARPSRYELQARRNTYYSDDLYTVKWGGAAFSVVRRADHHVMSSGHATETAATRAVANLYPSPV